MTEQSRKFEKEVEALKNMYIGWLTNIQKDVYAKGGFIQPEVIAQAFKELTEHYDILAEDMQKNVTDTINKMLGNEEG